MRSILLVEDNDDIREMVVELLRPLGLEVVEAENGLVALTKLVDMAKPPGVVLLDLAMPVMGGVELLNILESTGRLTGLSVVVLSAGGHASQVPSATVFMRKPIDPTALITLVSELCGVASP